MHKYWKRPATLTVIVLLVFMMTLSLTGCQVEIPGMGTINISDGTTTGGTNGGTTLGIIHSGAEVICNGFCIPHGVGFRIEQPVGNRLPVAVIGTLFGHISAAQLELSVLFIVENAVCCVFTDIYNCFTVCFLHFFLLSLKSLLLQHLLGSGSNEVKCFLFQNDHSALLNILVELLLVSMIKSIIHYFAVFVTLLF